MPKKKITKKMTTMVANRKTAVSLTYKPTTKPKVMTTQTEILKALGGRKFLAMTGATCYADQDTLIVKFKGSPKANIMYVTLTSSDLYDVKICKFKNLDVKPVFEAKGMYFDSLPSTFTQITGLYTSL